MKKTKKISIFNSCEPGILSCLYVIILIIMCLSQLFNFDDFLILLESFWLPGGESFARLIGGVIVVSEVFALPFLLKMKLTPFVSEFSKILGLAVPIIWTSLVVWLSCIINAVKNVGFFGDILKIKPDWTAVVFCVCLITLAIFSDFNFSPIKKKNKL